MRAAALAGLGGMVGAGCLVVAYAMSPRVIIEMDRDLPRRVVSGLYGAESAGQRTFAWTARQAEFRFRGLRRESAWACRLALRGGRGDAALQPVAELAVDGLTLARLQATDEFQEIEVTAPRRPQAGLTLTVKSSSVVVPPGDPRELGLQLDWLTCRPVDAAYTLRRPLPSGQQRLAALFSAPYSGFQSATPDRGGMAAAACFGTGHSALLRDRPVFHLPRSRLGRGDLDRHRRGGGLDVRCISARRKSLSRAGRIVLLFTGCVVYLKLLGLLHPSKAVIDAVFHAHRLQAVLSGGNHFTQVMPKRRSHSRTR